MIQVVDWVKGFGSPSIRNGEQCPPYIKCRYRRHNCPSHGYTSYSPETPRGGSKGVRTHPSAANVINFFRLLFGVKKEAQHPEDRNGVRIGLNRISEHPQTLRHVCDDLRSAHCVNRLTKFIDPPPTSVGEI
jgi:hypothetical protein